MVKTASLEIAETHTKPPTSAVAVAGSVEMYVPLGEIINVQEEIARLEKELARVEKDLARVERNLSNENFLNRAPAHIVEQEKERKAELDTVREALLRNLKMLRGQE
ncbi:MAG: hypothetical protein KatS3mg115_0396 [Candidatus Poribacteria bacterium]|nr:MAG: hypothetical protein KatS3mg115_0396 [Candidatus Poribacteria bacterium]